MEKIILKEVITKAFDILESKKYITYTKKYTREYLIEGFSQEDITPHYKWFNLINSSSLSRQLSRQITNNMNKPKGKPWFNHLIFITGHKWCNNCKTAKRHEDFNNSNAKSQGLSSICKTCDNERNSTYRINNPEKVIESRKNTYEKKKEEDPVYFKRKNALARRRLRQRTPKWITEEEKVAIQDFYANCPEGYHVDHIIPLNGKLVCGLHVLSNLQYLAKFDNLSKSNSYTIE